MYRRISGVTVAAILAVSLIGMSLLFTGCTMQETSSQSNPQQTGGTLQQQNMQQQEDMEPPAEGERPRGGGPGNMGGGFNLTEEELQEKLDIAVSEGTITQEQADEILAWWLERPETTEGEADEAQMEVMQEWMQQQPESTMEIFGGMRGQGGGTPPQDGGGPPPQMQQ